MDIKVYPGKLKGEVKAPPSKSMAHRALICAALSDGTAVVKGISGSKDMEATIGCMRALGADIEYLESGTDVRITGILAAGAGGLCGGDASSGGGRRPLLDCIESGSTLRFVLPVAAALGMSCDFAGRGKLPERPMTPLADEMKKKGITFSPDGRDSLPFSIDGKLQAGVYEIPGNISSQYISGLIFALPMLEGDSEIRITGNLESEGYINLTLQMVSDFGIKIQRTEAGFYINGSQKYKAADMEVEGDYSNAAFWMVARACGADLKITGLREDSAQGDKAAIDIISDAEAAYEQKYGNAVESDDEDECETLNETPEKTVDITERDLEKSVGRGMCGIEVGCRSIPDIVPILSVAATCAEGTTRFYDAGRLRIKESDRLAAMSDCLGKLGADVKELEEELIVSGSKLKGGCEVSGYNDHRIVMSMAIAALICEEPVVIKGAEAVAKSYPDFFDEFRRLGGRADVITDR